MTTSVRFINEGPWPVTLKVTENGKVTHEAVVLPMHVSSTVTLWTGKSVEITETPPTKESI